MTRRNGPITVRCLQWIDLLDAGIKTLVFKNQGWQTSLKVSTSNFKVHSKNIFIFYFLVVFCLSVGESNVEISNIRCWSYHGPKKCYPKGSVLCILN